MTKVEDLENILSATQQQREFLHKEAASLRGEVDRMRRLLNEAAEELKNAWEGSWGDIPQDSVYHVIVGDN